MRKFAVLMAITALVLACKKSEQATTGSSTTVTTTAKEPAKKEQTPTAEIGSNVGQKMPAYATKYLDGREFALASEQNKVVLLNVWATWCGPCRAEMPELQALHDKYAARGFEVIGASVDEGDSQVVKDFAAQYRITYPLVHDPEGKIAAVLDASVLPTTVLIDRNGRIVLKHIGQIQPKDDELAKAIEKAL